MQEKPQLKALHHVLHALQAPILMLAIRLVIIAQEEPIQVLQELHPVIVVPQANMPLRGRLLAVIVWLARIQL